MLAKATQLFENFLSNISRHYARRDRDVAATLKVVQLDFYMCADADTDRSYKPVLTVH